MLCPHCGTERINMEEKCHYCGYVFSDEYYQLSNKDKKKVVFSINTFFSFFVGIWFFVSLTFFGVGLFCTISEHKKAEGFEKTTAFFYDYTDCEKDDDGVLLCHPIYKYYVNGVTYTSSPNQLGSIGNFDEEVTVYYNPNNPSESIIYADWMGLVVSGGIMLVFSTLMIIGKRKLIKAFKNSPIQIKNNPRLN